jgi:hypothetical protein
LGVEAFVPSPKFTPMPMPKVSLSVLMGAHQL